MRIPSTVVDQYVYIVCVDSTDFVTRETGKTSGDFTVYRARNGASAVAMTTPTISEVSAPYCPGVYSLLLDEDMTIAAGNDTEEMVFHISATGVAPITRTIELYRPKITAGETLTSSSGKATVGTNDDKTAYSLSVTPPTAAQVYTEFTSGSNEDAFKADVSALATTSALSSVSGTCDTILIDTNDLQTNQGSWVTATGFATSSALSTVSTNVSTIISTGSTGPWTTGSGGGGGSGTTVYIGYAPDRIGNTDVTLYEGETYTVTIEPKDRKGDAVDLSAKTMYVVIENDLSGKDAVVIADGSLTKTSTSVSFSVGAVVTNTSSPSFSWSLRDNTTDEVYIKGMMFVEKAATKD